MSINKFISKDIQKMLESKDVFIFDFDGTISSTDKLLFAVFKRFCKDYGYDFTKKEYDAIRGIPSSDVYSRLKELLKKDFSQKEMMIKYLNYCDEIAKEDKLKCYDYVREVIALFPNKKYAIASNNIKHFLIDRVNEFGLENYFKDIFECGASGIDKQYVYENVKDLLGIEQNRCVVFEDSQKYIDSAKSFKITTVGLVHDYNKDLKADYIIDLSKVEK